MRQTTRTQTIPTHDYPIYYSNDYPINTSTHSLYNPVTENKNDIPVRIQQNGFHQRVKGNDVSSSQKIVVKPVINVFLNNSISNKSETSLSLASKRNNQSYSKQGYFDDSQCAPRKNTIFNDS